MSEARKPHSTSVLGCFITTVLGAALTLGCDTGASYDADGAEEPGTDPSSNPSDEPVPGSLLPSLFGTPEQVGTGSSSDRWHKTDVTRDGLSYLFMANGWGPNF